MPGTERPMSGTYYAAVRMPAQGDSGYYYGWVRFTMEAGVDQRRNEMVRVTVAESALKPLKKVLLRQFFACREQWERAGLSVFYQTERVENREGGVLCLCALCISTSGI